MRLYGIGRGFSSQARVTSGFKGVLERTGALSGFRDVSVHVQEGNEGATAKTAFFTGPLKMLHLMKFNASHKYRWVMVAPNSTEIGSSLAQALEANATHLMTPSEWAKGILGKHVKLPVFVMRHGVEPGFAPNHSVLEELRKQLPERFLALHLSSTEFERKGTQQLVSAWWSAFEEGLIPRGSRLWMILEPGSPYHMQAGELQKVGIRVVARGGAMGAGLSAESMAQIYQRSHVVIQPSRGEGFGMVPLEVRACGVPVVATLCTGHSEHMTADTPGLVVVPHGELEPIDDMPHALGPAVTVEAVKEALVRAYDEWPTLVVAALAAAPQVREEWSWDVCLKELVNLSTRFEDGYVEE